MLVDGVVDIEVIDDARSLMERLLMMCAGVHLEMEQLLMSGMWLVLKEE